MYNPIDIAYLAVMAYGVWKGMTQGFTGAVIAFMKFALGIFLALRFSYTLSVVLQRLFHVNPLYTPLLSFIVMLVGIMGILFILSSALDMFVKAAHLGSFNRAAGIAMWLFLLTLGFSGLLTLGENGKLLSGDMCMSSKVYPYVSPIANLVYCKMSYIMPATGQIIDSMGKLTQDISNAAMGDCKPPPSNY